MVEGHVSVRACGFESHPGHEKRVTLRGLVFFWGGFANSDLRMPLGGDRVTEIDNLLFPWPIPSDIRMASKSMAKTECFILKTIGNHGHLNDMVWFE